MIGHPPDCRELPFPLLLEPESGFLQDGDLRVSAHVRVRNGRRFCPHAVGHALKEADPDVVYGRFRGNWWCDCCHKVREVLHKEGNRKMFHCQAGCEFDLCEACMLVQMF